MASDNLNENYTTVVIHVNDVNDNPPVFDRPTYETQITEEDDRNLPKRVLKVHNDAFTLWCVFLVEICFRLIILFYVFDILFSSSSFVFIFFICMFFFIFI